MDDRQKEELEELGTFVSNFAIRYGKNRQMSAIAIGFLKLAAEDDFAEQLARTSDR
jgi:hypothetical protein